LRRLAFGRREKFYAKKGGKEKNFRLAKTGTRTQGPRIGRDGAKGPRPPNGRQGKEELAKNAQAEALGKNMLCPDVGGVTLRFSPVELQVA